MPSLIEHPAPPDAAVEVYRRSRKFIKLVTCILRPEKLDVVTASLNKLNLVGGMTVTDVRGVGREKTEPEIYRGARFVASFVSRIKVELAIEAEDVREIQNLVAELGRTGEVGDGKIFVSSVVDAYRIRTGERGASAL